MFWLKHQRWSEANRHGTAASGLKSPVSKQTYNLITSCFIVAVNSTEGACTTSTVNQVWVKPLCDMMCVLCYNSDYVLVHHITKALEVTLYVMHDCILRLLLSCQDHIIMHYNFQSLV